MDQILLREILGKILRCYRQVEQRANFVIRWRLVLQLQPFYQFQNPHLDP